MFTRLLIVLICSSVSWASPQSKQLPRIDPKGIGGTLILAGSETTERAVTAFVKASGELEENKNILFFSSDDSQTTQQARRILKGLVPEDRLSQTCEPKELLHQLDKAQALWIAGENTEALLPHDDALQNFLRSGKAIGTSANIHALGLLPDAHLSALTNEELLERDSHLVVYELDADAALLVRGRLIRNIGPGKVRIRRNTRKGQPPSTLTLSPENPIADLTALRRTARDATLNLQPSHPNPLFAAAHSSSSVEEVCQMVYWNVSSNWLEVTTPASSSCQQLPLIQSESPTALKQLSLKQERVK